MLYLTPLLIRPIENCSFWSPEPDSTAISEHSCVSSNNFLLMGAQKILHRHPLGIKKKNTHPLFFFFFFAFWWFGKHQTLFLKLFFPPSFKLGGCFYQPNRCRFHSANRLSPCRGRESRSLPLPMPGDKRRIETHLV